MIDWIIDKEKEHETLYPPLPEKFPYSYFFCSLFSRIWTEFGEIWSNSQYSVWMQRNKDQKIFEYGHFSRSAQLYYFTFKQLRQFMISNALL